MLETLLFLGSECILRQGQVFFHVLMCSIQPLSLHAHMPLPSLWGHHKELQPQEKASAFCANWFYLCAQQVEEQAWLCTQVHRE